MSILQILYNEIINDPLGRGYSNMTNAEIAESINTINRSKTKSYLNGSIIYETIDISEYILLPLTEKEEVWNIIHLGENIDVRPGSKARTRFISIFGVGSNTISALANILNIPISRGEELGIGEVSEGLVFEAKALGG